MTDSTLVSPVKMEYGWNFSISGLKMMMKSGLGKIFLKFLHALTMLFLLLNLYFWSKFSNKNDMVSAWRNFKNIFPRPLFIIIFRPEMLKFHPYSILTRDTRVEFVIHILCVKVKPLFFEKGPNWKKKLWDFPTFDIFINVLSFTVIICCWRVYHSFIWFLNNLW